MKTSIKSLSILLASLAAAATFSSCVTTPEKKHVYQFDDPADGEVSQLPFSRPQSFEGNPFGSNTPQSR
jgi:hypothetical protein